MRLQPLYDLQQEINRLFIAGSKFAKGDPRLQKQIPVFEKLGEKAPVFKKIASDIEDLVNADSQQSSEKLMAISTLLYSILYTQGEAMEEDVEIKPLINEFDINDVNTDYSYIQLKPVIEALTVSNSGRLEVLKEAFDRGIFNDFRTFQYLDFALADKYSELADYVADKVIPKAGSAILPFLVKNFNYEDKTENVRRFRLLAKLNYEEISTVIDKILSENLPNLQAEAINMLSGDSNNEALIIKLADDKNRTVREAAYRALVKLNTKSSLEKLLEVYQKNKNKTNLPGIINAIASSKLPFFFQEVFNQFTKTLDEFLALDKTTDDKIITAAFEKLITEIELFQNKEKDEVYQLFKDLILNNKYNALVSSKKSVLGYQVDGVTRAIIKCLETFENKEKVFAFYAQIIPQMPDVAWNTAFHGEYFEQCIEAEHSKEQIYELFIEAFKKKYISIYHLYSEIFKQNDSDDEDNNTTLNLSFLDERWIDHLYTKFDGKIKWDNELNLTLSIINAYEPQNCKRFDDLLKQVVHNLNPNEAATTFQMLMDRNVSDKFEIIFSVVSKYRKGSAYYYFYNISQAEFWKEFPKEYAPKMRGLYEKEKLELFKDIADLIEYN